MMIVEQYTKWPEFSVPVNLPLDDHRTGHWGDSERRKKIGPHQDRELTLMKAGIKPAALLDLRELSDWQSTIDEFGWIVREIPSYHPTIKQYVVALPGEEARLNQIERIYTKVNTTRRMSDLDHAKLGRLLGYSKEQIRAFITSKN